ncbi:hypothetical protein J1N35_023940 [Gossypium stocksii]|uniref:DUF4283 domain-containing protein n=1 Tax=Gossypium stocksii TaxID=47602 RepID=A0A9D3VKK1_9ROSI|nr:hypothetical protein J1N35_023940 [Gossypium stocksii]
MDLREHDGSDEGEPANRSTKKVRIRDIEENRDVVMEATQETGKSLSWKDRLMGLGLYSNEKTIVAIGTEEDEDIELTEDDVERSTINGIPSIKFSDRINQILIKHMEFTVVIKLLGRNIGYNALQNKVNSLWKPSQPFRLMDVENGYFLAKFKNPDDYEKALCQGPWEIFGQYLTVQPWTMDFNSTQPYPSTVMAWIRLFGLSGHMYKRQVLREIGATIGKVAKLDFNTDNGVRGRFARMAVFINLDKALISQVIINGVTQRIEYEHLPTVCFQCGHYGHTKYAPKKRWDWKDSEKAFQETNRNKDSPWGKIKERPQVEVYTARGCLLKRRQRKQAK